MSAPALDLNRLRTLVRQIVLEEGCPLAPGSEIYESLTGQTPSL
jgi:hypothetical protein